MTATQQYCCHRMRLDFEQRCELHPDRRQCPDNFIAQVRGGYGLIVHDGGSAVREIAYCPWCGTHLPPIKNLDLPNGDDDV